MTTPDRHDASRFKQHLEGVRTCMLMTHKEERGLYGRPMTVADVDDDGAVWIATRNDADLVEDIEATPVASITAQGSSVHLFASGSASIFDGAEAAKAHWSEMLRPWFPDGPTDPDLTMLRFEPAKADVWTTSTSRGDAVRFAFDAAKAVLTGRSVAGDEPGHVEHLSP